MNDNAIEIMKRIQDLGFESFFVGGCVRDHILGLDSHDTDITTNCPMGILEANFDTHDIGNSKDFGLLVVTYNEESFEVAQFREDDGYNGRSPEIVTIVNDFKSDVSRRDFTINAIGMDINGAIVDFFNGKADIEAGIIKAVGDPNVRFEEDYLRMLRAIRFAARFGFTVDPATSQAISDSAHNIRNMAAERIKDELFKTASYGGEVLARFIEICSDLGVLVHFLPELEVCKHTKEEQEWHPEAYKYGDGSTFAHIMAAVRKSESKDALKNVCVLLHDVGKAVTWEVIDGRNRFRKHDTVGAHLGEDICTRLKMSSFERGAIIFCIRGHMAMTHVRKMKKSTIIKWMSTEHSDHLFHTVWCDDSCREEVFDVDRFQEVVNIIEKVKADFGEMKKATKIVNGKQVMEVTGLKQGPEIGRIISEVSERFLDSDEFVCIRKLIVESAVKSNDMR